MSVSLTKFTRSLRVYPSQHPIPSPYVLAQGIQITEGNVCYELEIINEQSCDGECREIYAENNNDEGPSTIGYTTCNGISGTMTLYGGQDLGCLSNWYIIEGNVDFFENGSCGPTPGPAQVVWLDCDGNENSQDVDCSSSFYMGCVQEILEISGGECYTNELSTCGNFAPNILFSNGLDFAANGVSVGDVVYVYDETNSFQLITVVTGLSGNYAVYTEEYIPNTWNFTIYQQSAQSGLGNRGCTLYFPQGFIGEPLYVTSIAGSLILRESFYCPTNSLFPIQASHLTNGSFTVPIYALW